MKIKYLSHATRFENLESIINGKYLYTTFERQSKQIAAKGLNPTFKSNKKYSLDEFPGIFMSWHTGKNKVLGSINLIFGGDILKMQTNYHINLVDRNGYFTETLTYFAEDLESIPIKEARAFWNSLRVPKSHVDFNEVVFHDKIHVDLIAYIWFDDETLMEKAKEILPNHFASKCMMKPEPKKLSMNISTPTSALDKVNRSATPIRVFTSDARYDGVKIPLFLPDNKHVRYKSSLRYVKSIARRAGVSETTLRKLQSIESVEAHLEHNGYYHKEITSRQPKNWFMRRFLRLVKK